LDVSPVKKEARWSARELTAMKLCYGNEYLPRNSLVTLCQSIR